MTRSEWQVIQSLKTTAPTLAAVPADALRNARQAMRKRRLRRAAKRAGATLATVAAFLATATSLSAPF